MTRSIYDPNGYPEGVPNPLGYRVHAWNEGDAAYGTRYHGAVWTKPMWRQDWAPQPMRGLGSANDVATRDGIFTPNGYGGGIFNQNTGFGGVGRYEQASAGIQGLGAADPGLVVLQRYLNVWLQMNGYCTINEDGVLGAKTCGAWQASGTTSDADADMRNLCSAKGYTAPSRPPCAGGAPAQAPEGARIASDQILANAWLTANGYCEIDVDGVLGPKTCGAFRAAGTPIPASCTSFTAPSRGPCPGAVYTPPEQLPGGGGETPGPITSCPPGQVLVGDQCVAAGPAPAPAKKGISTAWMLVGGLGLAAIIAGAAYAAKKHKETGG